VSELFAETTDGCETNNKEIAAIIVKDFLALLFMSKL
jgi:hypothetical protein